MVVMHPWGLAAAFTVKRAVPSLDCTGQGLLTSSASCHFARCDARKGLSVKGGSSRGTRQCMLEIWGYCGGVSVAGSAHCCVENMVM